MYKTENAATLLTFSSVCNKQYMGSGVNALGRGDDQGTVDQRKGLWIIVPVSSEEGGCTAPPYEKGSKPNKNIMVVVRVEDILVDEVRA